MTVVQQHFDNIASRYDKYKEKNWYYYTKLKILLKKKILPNKIVLEIGCGTGDLLKTVNPKLGIGIDVSRSMIEIASKKHPDKYIQFLVSDIRSYKSNLKFDYIFMSDVIEHLTDTNECIRSVSKLMDKNTKLLITMANPKWEWILILAEKLGLKMPEGPHDRIYYNKIEKIMSKFRLKITDHNWNTLIPVYLPLITSLINIFFYKMLRKYAFIEYLEVQKY